MAYDPNQNPEDKRRIRQQYRGLMVDDDGNTLKASNYTTEQLVETVHRADEIFQGVRAPGEATLDSNLLLMMSNMGAAKARAMKAGGASFDIDDFVARLLSVMASGDPDESGAPGPLDWEIVGRKALAVSRRAPAMDFMLGPLQVEQKKRAAKQRAKLDKNKADEQKPQEMREEDIQRSENETTKNVIMIKELLEAQGQVNLFRFIINPNDFAQSVENMFHLSFLIRDGECAMEIEDGEPVVYICERPSQEDYEQGLKKQQLVLEFDMETWEEAIKTFNITDPMIPQRRKAQKAAGNKWYG
ncbi:Nse4 C-terminal-domain-containing protein [Vararia minispora EC-137]|uniref:Nse4 C-terminal-domain-containing protein n=1 Tax=Vararia minispora EC-137 TaxID=1314806 RepID=A0ACB8QED3_9AGAM|nr:Nse4 C-terminal-domain-containing protein [Vararia minispora EC-137]